METKAAYKKNFEIMLERLKDQGVDFGKSTAEAAAKIIYTELTMAIKNSVTDSDIPYDDIYLAIDPIIGGAMAPILDGINPND